MGGRLVCVCISLSLGTTEIYNIVTQLIFCWFLKLKYYQKLGSYLLCWKLWPFFLHLLERWGKKTEHDWDNSNLWEMEDVLLNASSFLMYTFTCFKFQDSPKKFFFFATLYFHDSLFQLLCLEWCSFSLSLSLLDFPQLADWKSTCYLHMKLILKEVRKTRQLGQNV